MKKLTLIFLFSFYVLNGIAQNKPNIVYILCDDMGYGDLSCYGQKDFATPTIDSIAKSGMRFTQHYAGSPVCAPSRASLMTGRDPAHCRVRGNYEVGPDGFGAGLELLPSDVTLGEVAKMAGYHTAVIGKWGMGMEESTGAPNKQGFDLMYGFLNQAHAHYQFPDYLWRNNKKEYIKENSGGKNGAFSNDIFTKEAIKYVSEQKKGKPFFLYLAYVTPHAEMIVPDDSIFRSFVGKFPEIPFTKGKQGTNGENDFGAYRSQKYPAAAYAAMVVRIDRDVAKVIAQLKKQGLDKNTVIMFSSDNGSHKEGGSNPAYHKSNGDLRGAKRDVYEGGIREPFIVSWPGVVKPGQVSNQISAFWDIMPTFADIFGVDLKKEKVVTDGFSLMPTLTDNTSAQKQHPFLYWEFHENKTSDQAVRKGDWKAVRHDPDAKGVELYNLKTDISESKDVSSKYPQIAADLKHIMDTARTPNPYFPLKRSSDLKINKPN
ncbi:arylsulfatase [Pedobacter sp. SD-b]|uniref:Arylsulfatase n=1 Tax=Pedobacter segetis TaxID=2793069 RepID=A0ABS1BMC0_9SPHI|nr:arylsulfatase [Pedobacter segetis]MBK0384049.1 arylsulfatase [Pedobacter segetis]